MNDLKQQVRNFLMHKSIHETRALVSRQRFNAGVLRTTKQFFQVFRTGFREWELHEATFLAAIVDQDVALGSIARGTTIFFDQWRRYKKMFRQRSFSITSTRILVSDSESCVFECKGEFEGKLTLAAIAAVFPHVLKDAVLFSKVVNCRLICPTRTLIYFDESGRIVQYNAHVDMFAGLNQILASNPMDVIMLMARARISSEGSMIPNVREDGVVDVDIEYDRSRVDQRITRVEEVVGEERGMVTGEKGLSSYPSPSESDRSNDSDRSSIEYILSL